MWLTLMLKLGRIDGASKLTLPGGGGGLRPIFWRRRRF